MARIIFCALLLLCLPRGFTAQPGGWALVVVEEPAVGTTCALLESGFSVVSDMNRYLLVAATPEDCSRLDGLGLDWRVIDDDVEGKTYYIATLREDTTLERIRRKVRILRHDGTSAVIEAPPQLAERITADGADIIRVFLRPLRLPPRTKPDIRKADAADPMIERLVASVSADTIDSTVLRLQNFVTRYSSHASCQAAANDIKARFESFGIDRVYFHHWSEEYRDNVVAVLPGVGDSGEIVVIGGHYDSTTGDHEYCPGADDNASGTAGVLECARVLAGSRFQNTIVLAAFCGEEQGLLGSAAFAREAVDRGDNIIAMINMDIIGYLAPGDDLDVDVEDDVNSQWLRDLAIDVGALYVPDLPVVVGHLAVGGSDHGSFRINGYDAIMLFEDGLSPSPYIHTANDVVGTSYVSPALAQGVVRVAAALGATLAEPFYVTIRHTPLESCIDPSQPCPVTAEVEASTTLNPDSLFVRYWSDGGNGEVPLVYTGVGNRYEAYIPSRPVGQAVDYCIVAETVEGYRATHPRRATEKPHRFVVGSPHVIAKDDFETNTGWVVGDVDDDASTGIWARVDPNGTTYQNKPVQPEDDHTARPGARCFVTGNAQILAKPTDNDVDLGKTTLFSPLFDLSGYPHVWARYYRWYSNDTGGDVATDEWVVDVSPDSGQSWVRLETLATSRREWQLVDTYLSDVIPLTSGVQFRFIASDYGAESVVEAAVDDFSLTTYVDSTGSMSSPGTPGYVSLSQNFPNPFNPETHIRIDIGGSGEWVTLRVFDVAGRLVTTLLQNEFVAGERTVSWDGRRQGGEPAATGVYFYRLDAGGRSVSRKLVVLR